MFGLKNMSNFTNLKFWSRQLQVYISGWIITLFLFLIDLIQQCNPSKHDILSNVGSNWASIVDNGPTLTQHWANVLCFLWRNAYMRQVFSNKVMFTFTINIGLLRHKFPFFLNRISFYVRMEISKTIFEFHMYVLYLSPIQKISWVGWFS